MKQSLRVLLDSLIDYAGMFPPASLSFGEALRRYENHRRSEFAWALGRFVVPFARVDEVPPDMPLSVLMNRDELHLLGVRASLPAAERASLPGPDAGVADPDNRRHAGSTPTGGLGTLQSIDTIEVKAANEHDVDEISGAAGSRTVYVETTDVDLLASIHAHGLRAKIRTGGLVQEAIPSSARVARFIRECAAIGLPFKATAGLHHPVRCVRPLTYEPGAPTGTMHGFVNVFMAAALVGGGEEILLETDPSAFEFTDESAAWRGRRITTTALTRVRSEFAISFGSCSFDEPIADLKALGWA